MKNIYKFLLIVLAVACATVAVLFQQHILSLPHYFVGLDTLLIVLGSAITLACVFVLWRNYNNHIVLFDRDKHQKTNGLFKLEDQDINPSLLMNIESILGSPEDIKKMTHDLFSEWAKQENIPDLPDNFYDHQDFDNIAKFIAILFAIKNNKLNFSGMSKEVKQEFRGADDFINTAYQLLEKISDNYDKLEIETWPGDPNMPWKKFRRELSNVIEGSFVRPLSFSDGEKVSAQNTYWVREEKIFPLIEKLWENGLFELSTDAKKVKLYQPQPIGLQLLLLFLALGFTLIPVLIKTQVIMIPQYLFSIDLVLAVTAAIIATAIISFLTWQTLFPSMTTIEINSTSMTSEDILFLKNNYVSNLITNISVYAVGTEEYFNQMLKFSDKNELGLRPIRAKGGFKDRENYDRMKFFEIWKLIALIQDGKLRFQGLSKELFDKFNVFRKDCFTRFKKFLKTSKPKDQEYKITDLCVSEFYENLLVNNQYRFYYDAQREFTDLVDPLCECIETASEIEFISP